MLNLVTKALASVFGTKSDRDIKGLLPVVEQVNTVFQQLRDLSDDQLRQASQELKQVIKERLQGLTDQISSMRTQATTGTGLTFSEKEELFKAIDAAEKQHDAELEKVLLELLPNAFAIVKETARRLSENKQLVVTSTDFDREYAQANPHVVISGETATWSNTWNAAGAPITWDMIHYDVQLIGGSVLHSGKISEMATGEGKTLVATLPTFLNALAGKGVHIVTVNDYLAKRDSEWMGPLFAFHLLKVDCIDKHEPNSEARRQAYLADITYGTNNEFGFDYLRDNMARDPEELVQRKLHYAMVDEVDSVLIDDARTPLIISGPMSHSDEQAYEVLKPRVYALVEAQKTLVLGFLNEAKKKIAAGNTEEGGLALFRAHRGLPKLKPLIKFLSEQGIKAIMQKTEANYLADNQRLMPEADKPLYFRIIERDNTVELTDKGIEYITAGGEDTTFFVLPDIGGLLSQVEGNKTLSEEEVIIAKDQIISDYTEKSGRIHVVQQLLKAYTLFEREVEYIVQEGKVKIVDEQTGRILDGRRYSDGLHQAIEAKENVIVEKASQTYATVTLQNFFRMYHKLAGMTGTAETEAGEFWSIYKLDVVVIPTNKPISRKDEHDKVYKTEREKFNAVVDEIVALVAKGRPVLVGTTSVENSEKLSRMLKLRSIPHQVLNAKYHQKEAEIVAQAGGSGIVTIATNMAGRGTDIKLSPEAKAAGGLAIIGTERHESRRVDRQLRGRAGRQGDNGSSQFFVSLEDQLMRLFGSENIVKLMDRLGLEEGEVIQHSMITSSIERAQKKVEENNFSIRKRLLEYDDVMNNQREVVYKRRRNALFGDKLDLDIMNMIYQACDTMLDGHAGQKGKTNHEDFRIAAHQLFGIVPMSVTEEALSRPKSPELTKVYFREVMEYYRGRMKGMAEVAMPVFAESKQVHGEHVDTLVVPFTNGKVGMQIPIEIAPVIETNGQHFIKTLEKVMVTSFIDQHWITHLRDMDDLKQSVQNAVFEQKDPLLTYKFEALNLFKAFLNKVNEETLTFLFKVGLPLQDETPPQAAVQQVQQPMAPSRLQESRPAYDEAEVITEEEAPVAKAAPIRSQNIPGRNDKVTVRYANGLIKRDVKFKAVEEDLRAGLCELVSLS